METSESEGEKKKKKRFSFSGRSKSNPGSASEDGEKKKRSSVFGRKKKSSVTAPPVPPTNIVEPDPTEPGHIEVDMGESKPLEQGNSRNYQSLERRREPANRIPKHLEANERDERLVF